MSKKSPNVSKPTYRILVSEEKNICSYSCDEETSDFDSENNLSTRYKPKSRFYKKQKVSNQINKVMRSYSESNVSQAGIKILSKRPRKIVGVKKAKATCSSACLIS